MINKQDGSPPGLADQFLQPPLAVDQWQVAQVDAIVLNQVEGEQPRLMTSALASERVEVRCAILAGDHRLAIDQERCRPDATGSVCDRREAVNPVMTTAREAADLLAILAHYQALAVSWTHDGPDGGRTTRDG